MKPRPLRIRLKKAIGFALLLIGSASGDALTFWKVDELRDEGEARLSSRGDAHRAREHSEDPPFDAVRR
jgi:hypothetical protein